MSIITHQVRSVAATDTIYDDFFRIEHMRSSSQGLHSIFTTTQAFLEDSSGITAFKTHTGDIMTITPSGYSLSEASYKDSTYCLGSTITGEFGTTVRFATLAPNPLEQPGNNLALLNTANDLLVYKLENKQLTKRGELSLSTYLMNTNSSTTRSLPNNSPSRDDAISVENTKAAMSGASHRLISDTHDMLDTLIASYQKSISAKLPITESSDDIIRHPCSCAIGTDVLAFSIDRTLYLTRLSDPYLNSTLTRKDSHQNSQTFAVNMPTSVFKHRFSSEINSLYILSDGPNEAAVAVSSASVCTIIKVTGLGTDSPKIGTQAYSLSQAVFRESSAYITAAAVSPFIADYWVLGTNQGQLLIISSKSEQPVFSTMLFSLPIISLSFSPLHPDIFSVSSRHKIMLCQYISSLTIMAQFIAPQFVSIIAGGIHCTAPAQPLSLWYGLDNSKLVFESLGINYPKWTKKVVTSFLRGIANVQSMYDKVSCACHKYGTEFIDNYISFSSLMYSREFKQCYSFIFSLVNAIDESGMPMATELMQYFFGLLRPIQQYFQASQTTSTPRLVPPMPSLNKVLLGFSLSIPSSLNKKYCLMPSLTEALQYSAYEIRFKLDDTCARMKLSEGQIQEKLLKELDTLLSRAVEVCLKVKDDIVVSLVLLRSIFDVAILIDRKRHDVTVYRYFSELLDVLRVNPNSAAIFLKPIYPSILSLRGTMRLDEFFIAAVAPVKNIINSLGDSKDNKQNDLKWSEHAIWSLYASIFHPATRATADFEYRDNASNTKYLTLTTFLSQKHNTSRDPMDDTISSFSSLCEKQDKLFGAISGSHKVPMTPEMFAELLDTQFMGSQFVLLESLYGYIYSHAAEENSHKISEICTTLITIFNSEVIGTNTHRQMGPADKTGFSSQKDEIYNYFELKEITTPVKKYENIFVPLPILGAIYGFIMTVFWPRTLHDLSNRMNNMDTDHFSKFLAGLYEVLTNVYAMANISPNSFIERYVPNEVCNMFRYNIQGTRVRAILEKFIKTYIASIQKTSDPTKVAIYQQDAATCKKLMSFFAEVRLTEFESTIDKLRRELSNAIAGTS